MRLSGNLDRIELLTLINFLSLQRRTGIFLIKDGEKEATLFFKEGDIIDAEYLGERGEPTFYNILNIPEMEFTFTETPVKIERRINIPTEILVLNAVKKIDEEKELFIPSLLEAI